jgi:predicted RNA binding protein YcfA (HicA-like mRNA interferase family)
MSELHQIRWKEFEKFLAFIGCTFVREKGDHRIWSRPRVRRPIVVPRNNPLPIFIIRNNLRLLDISTEDFLELMEKL